MINMCFFDLIVHCTPGGLSLSLLMRVGNAADKVPQAQAHNLKVVVMGNEHVDDIKMQYEWLIN